MQWWQMSFRESWGLKEFAKKLQKISQSGPCRFPCLGKNTFEVVRVGHHAPKYSEHLVHNSLTLKKEFATYKMDHKVRTSPGESRVVDFLPYFFPFTFWVVNSLLWSYLRHRAKLVCHQKTFCYCLDFVKIWTAVADVFKANYLKST